MDDKIKKSEIDKLGDVTGGYNQHYPERDEPETSDMGIAPRLEDYVQRGINDKVTVGDIIKNKNK